MNKKFLQKQQEKLSNLNLLIQTFFHAVNSKIFTYIYIHICLHYDLPTFPNAAIY